MLRTPNENDQPATLGGRAEFFERRTCIGCESPDLETIDQGRFDQPPHRTRYEASPWGEDPMPYLEGCTWELVRCRCCDQIFHKRILTAEWDEVRHGRWMTEEAIAAFEERIGARTPAAVFGKMKREFEWVLIVEKMTRELRGDRAVRWLDFGCGWGRVVELARLAGFAAFGVDKSSGRRHGAEVQIFESLDALREHQSEPFHVVSMYEVLEHLSEPMGLLKALRGLLQPSGLLIVEVPDGTGFDNLTRGGPWGIADGLDHLNAFDPTTLTRMVERAGFAKIPGRPTPQVSADWRAILKREARRVVDHFRRETTSQIFRKLP